MKWPFARPPHSPATPIGDTGTPAATDQTRADGHGEHESPTVVTSRRDWATLPPLHVAGGRPISLTAATRAFTDSLASRQVLVRSPRLEHVRPVDAPSGSFRGVLSPAIEHDVDSGPEPQAPSPLPAIEHRQLAAMTGDRGARAAAGLSPIEQLLAIG